MIRHPKKNGNKKNVATLREKIIALVAKHSRYPLDLYNTCARGSALTNPEFRQLLKDMHADGDIHIKTDNLVVLPKPPPDAPEPKPPPDAPTPPREIENSTDTLLIDCLVNRSHTLKDPKQKKSIDKRSYYEHRNYKISQIPLDSVCEETLLKGYQFIPGEFIDKHDTGIRNKENWVSQQVFLVEFDDTTESTLAEFIAARPFLRENAWLVTESLRSRYDDPHDPKCNGQLRLRIVLCMPRAVKTIDEREWVYEALLKALPGCDDGSANSITNGGLGKVGAEHVKIGKIVDPDWFKTAIATGQQKKAAKAEEDARDAEERERKQAERAAMRVHRARGRTSTSSVGEIRPKPFFRVPGLIPEIRERKISALGQNGKAGRYSPVGVVIRARQLPNPCLC